MGCTPSIHISQSTGIVICNQENSTESPTSALQPGVCVVKRVSDSSIKLTEVVSQGSRRKSSTVTVTATTTSFHITCSQEGSCVVLPSEPWAGGSGEPGETDQPLEGMDKATNCELQLGPVKVCKYPMEIQLIFGSDDEQSEAFLGAAKRGGYRCKLHYTAESATEYYFKHLPELVIIDLRSNVHFDGELLCRNMRTTRPDVNTIIIAVTKRSEKEETSVAGLLKAGFNRRFIEDHNITSCFNELLMLDKGEVSLQCKLRATSCLFSAVEHAYDAIEIQCVDPEKSEFQYVNPAYEKVTGYWRSELPVNSKNNILSNCEVPKPDSHDNIAKLLSKGKSWEGVCIARKKGGEPFVQGLKIVPVIGHAGRVTHYIIVKRDLTAVQQDARIQLMHAELKKGEVKEIFSDMMMEAQSGKEKVLAMEKVTSPPVGQTTSQLNVSSSLTEAPITKVINLLTAVQENSPSAVVQVLEKVIDILRTTELYTPSNFDQCEEKGAEADMVEGLMWNYRERRHSAECGMKGLVHRDSSQAGSFSHPQKAFQITQATPEIEEALQGCELWDYNIIKLEKVSNYRPLYYLGQALFTRFEVAEYLSVSDTIIRNWLQLIEANYHCGNTYHNSTHAADVLQGTSVFLEQAHVKNVLDHADEVAALIAAVVHDVDHPGYTNSFLCNAGSELAILYNDRAVLESHHAAMAFKLTSKDANSNIFQNLSTEEFKIIRQSIIDMVMATEMKQHFEHLAKFDNNLNKRHPSHDDNLSTNGRGTPDSTYINYQSSENKGVLSRMIIKCADIANPARPTELCRDWAFRIAEEYFRQTEEEQQRNLPIVMPVFDRNTCNVPKSQLFFMDYFVINLYTSWDNFAQVTEAMKFLRLNYEYWSKEAELLEKEKESSS